MNLQIFVYDGNSYKSKLIGSYSGQTDPQIITGEIFIVFCFFFNCLFMFSASSGFLLVMLFSDTNYVLTGFKAEFLITNCPKNCSNHGQCVNHACVCDSNWTGYDCGFDACNCGEAEKRGICVQNRCECAKDFSGQHCSLHKTNPEQSQWLWLTNSSNSFTRRAAHISVYNEKTDSLFVFGGYDLNRVLGSMEIFRFNTSVWEDDKGNKLKEKNGLEPSNSESLEENHRRENLLENFWLKASLLSHADTMQTKNKNFTYSNEPAARFGHAAAVSTIDDFFVIFGGKLSNGNLSNEFWIYNITSKSWSLRAIHSKKQIPALMRHTVTYVESNNFFYVFGGSLQHGDFSSQMFRIRITTSNNNEQWEEVLARGGKTLDFRIVSHSTNFYKFTNSLIVYGGIVANAARLSKLSDRMLLFDIENQHWTEIYYPKTIPREMSKAFHTATIAGDFLIVFGGYFHKHNKEESCYDNQMFLYNLKCHVWINSEALGTNRSNYPKKQGVFAHSANLRGKNTLLIVGGYHGNVNNDFLAFTLHDMMISSNNLTENEKCLRYSTSTSCISNSQCGFCSSDKICYGRTTSNCFTNLQVTNCPGLCSSLKDCQSCLIHGHEKCSWCVQNAKCHQKNDYESCGESDVIENIGYQWWGRKGLKIEDKSQCTKLDRPPGLYFLKYYPPFDFSLPDHLSLVNSTSVDFGASVPLSFNETPQNGEVVAKLSGFLRLPQEILQEVLKVCGSYAHINLKITSAERHFQLNAANFTADQNFCVNFILNQKKALIDLQAIRKLTNLIAQQHHLSRIGLQNNMSKPFSFEFLEPFSSNGNDCYQSSNCLLCLSDNACAWCDLTSSCLKRDVNETIACRVKNHWRYLTLKPDQCKNCSNFISCDRCTADNCEWLLEDSKCVRKARSIQSTDVINTVQDCPSTCSSRLNCSTCLNEKGEIFKCSNNQKCISLYFPGRCFWCENTQECFSFSVYTTEYQFGICREWVDSLASESKDNMMI